MNVGRSRKWRSALTGLRDAGPFRSDKCQPDVHVTTDRVRVRADLVSGSDQSLRVGLVKAAECYIERDVEAETALGSRAMPTVAVTVASA